MNRVFSSAISPHDVCKAVYQNPTGIWPASSTFACDNVKDVTANPT